jgi:hypothetical protein
VPDPRDIVDIAGLADRPRREPTQSRASRPWLGVWFRCCHVYGRMTKTPDGRMYRGRCPRCAAEVRAVVGAGGTSQRFFQTT